MSQEADTLLSIGISALRSACQHCPKAGARKDFFRMNSPAVWMGGRLGGRRGARSGELFPKHGSKMNCYPDVSRALGLGTSCCCLSLSRSY